MKRRHRSGFTLVEMMVAVAVVAMLGALALPHYHASLFRAQRVEAVLHLEAINASQQSYFALHDQFAPDFTRLDYRAVSLTAPNVAQGHRYAYTISRPWGSRSWICSASADLDGDPWPDLLVAYDRL